jgi:hypothetical protein
MRLLPLLLVVVGCATNPNDNPPEGAACDIGQFEIAAPREGLHYAPSLDVYVNETELWAELTLTMTDESGHTFSWTDDGSQPNPDSQWWNLDNFHYDLAPSSRYVLTVGHCNSNQTVTFFTSPE